MSARPAKRRRAALSLQTRAAVAIALGILAISGYVALSISNDTAIAASSKKAAQYRQLQVDNLSFMLGMVNQQSGIRGYTNTADPQYLASYQLGRQQASVRDRLRTEAKAVGLGPDIDATLRFQAQWQAWAEERKAAVDKAHRPQVDSAQAAQGNELFESMRNADQPISEVAEAGVSDATSQATTRLALEFTVLTTGALIAMVALTLLLGYFVAGVLRPVARLARVAQQLADDEDVRVPISNSSGEVGELSRALAAWQYSSAERLALTQLAAESESRFRLLFDRAPIGIARLARPGRIIETNPALQVMLGYSADELTGMTISDLFRPDDRVAGNGFMSGFRTGAQEHLQEDRLLVKKDGNPFWADVTLSIVRGADGEFQYIVAMFEDVTDRKRQAQALEHRALHDPLTDLPNRTLLFDRLHQAVLAAKREHQTMALLIMDLDGFKEINDTYGHQAGDVVLKQVAKRVRSRVRDADTVARLGGDEFAFVLAGDDQTGATEAAARVMKALEPPFTVKGKRFVVGASIGVAVFPQDGVHPDMLIRKADEAMYRAKRAGGGYAVSQTG